MRILCQLQRSLTIQEAGLGERDGCCWEEAVDEALKVLILDRRGAMGTGEQLRLQHI